MSAAPARPRRRLASAVAAAPLTLLLVVAVSGCGATRTDTTAATSATAARTDGTCDAAGNAQGVTDSTIKLGMVTPLTGPVADPGNGGLDGFTVAMDLANQAGGVQGRKLELVTQDDQYDASLAQQAIRKLDTSDKVFAIAGGVGTPNFVAMLPYLKEQHIPAVGPYAPSNQVGVMANPDVFMIWPNFVSEYEVAGGYVVKNLSPKSVSMVQLAGDVGDDAQKGLENALGGAGLKLDTVERVESTQTDFSSVAQSLKNTNSEWVATIIPPVATGQLIEAMNKIGYKPKLMAQSDMTDETWLSSFASVAEGMIVPTKVAPLANSTDPMVQDFVTKFTAATGKAPSLWNAVGYTQALVTIEALKTSTALTRDCFELSLEKMSGFETGLIPPVTFAADSRQGTNAVGVATIQSGQVVQVAPFSVVGQ